VRGCKKFEFERRRRADSKGEHARFMLGRIVTIRQTYRPSVFDSESRTPCRDDKLTEPLHRKKFRISQTVRCKPEAVSRCGRQRTLRFIESIIAERIDDPLLGKFF
jgi:hypothetical protein